MSYPTIKLRRGKEESLGRFHPWVFSGAIATLPDGLEEGDVVGVIAADGTLGGYSAGTDRKQYLLTLEQHPHR